LPQKIEHLTLALLDLEYHNTSTYYNIRKINSIDLDIKLSSYYRVGLKV